MIPKWLDLSSDLNLEIERAHRSLAPAPGVNDPPRSVLVRFLRFSDRERILHAALKKRQITHDDKQIRFYQDLSVEVMRKRREFDAVKRVLVDRKMFRGFAYPAKLRCLHESELRTFSTPTAFYMSILG
ncbi:LINE-1 type transposase domain-containing protein [Pimephales promelas]|nr:LINE-1 type transposase domain-containing protein [Pimephales promelas]